MDNQTLQAFTSGLREITPHDAQWWQLVIGLFAPIVALVIAIFSEQLKRSAKTSLKAIEVVSTSQTTDKNTVLYIHRLALKNQSRFSVPSIRCNIDRIDESDGVQSTPRNNFIPVPLNWTHYSATREIAGHEVAYLDVVQYPSDQPGYYFCWPGGSRPIERSLSFLSPEADCVLHLTFYAEDTVGTIKLNFKKGVLTILNSVPVKED